MNNPEDMELEPRPPRRSKIKPNYCIAKQGERIPESVRNIILDLLRQGHYTKGEIASACGVSRGTVVRYLDKDPELKEQYEAAWMETMQKVEQAMVTRATEGRNEMAAQQAGEFLLRHNTDRYNDKAVSPDRLASLPKIIVPIAVPVRTDPKDEAIDV